MSQNPSTVARGNIINQWAIAVTLSPVSVAASTNAEQTFTILGLHLGDFIWVNKPTTQTGLQLGGCRVSAKDTLAINFANSTGSPITPTASEVYTIFVARPDNLTSGNVALLSTLF
jgi:hypothetical protein